MLSTKRILVPEEILEIFFGNNYKGSLEIVSVAKSGSSGPKVVILRNCQKFYALKYGHTRVSISVQIENRKSLALYLNHRLPKVEKYCSYPGGQAMLMEAVDGPNLHEALMLGLLSDQDIIRTIEEILQEFSEIWYKTKSTNMELTRNPIERINKIIDLVYAELNNLQIKKDDQLVINGVDVGSPYELVLLLKNYSLPKFSVFCHSDLNADNFVINDSNSWSIVDWEWVGLHDWKLSLSHLFGWWSSNSSRLKKKPSLERVGSKLLLNYELVLPDIIKPIQDMCINYGNKVAEYMGESDTWRYQFSILFATLLLGDLRFLKDRGREEYSLALLGEGLTEIKRTIV